MFEKFLERGKLILVLFFVVLIVGGYLFYNLPKRELPEFKPNLVSISTVYPGANAEQVERDVTNRFEKALDDIKDIDSVNSVSTREFSNVIIEINDGAEFQDVADEIKQVMLDSSKNLPEGALDPTFNDDFGKSPISSYMVVANDEQTLEESKKAINDLKEKLLEVKGVSDVVIKGFSEEEAVFVADSEKLTENGLNVSSVIQAINNEFETTPLGSVQQNGQEYTLSLGNFKSIEDVETISLQSKTKREAVQLSELGSFEYREKEVEDIVTYKGKPAYSLTVNVEQGLDIPTIFTKVDEVVKNNENTLPNNVDLVTYYSQKADVDNIFKDLTRDALLAVIAVIIITTLGLTLSGAFIVSLAIPFSITLGAIPLPFLDVDLNQISVIGLIIALGILVDDAIVVNDNILRNYKEQGKILPATVNGIKEVWGSIITSTLAVVFAFLPLVFLSGGNGAFIRSLPTVLVLTIIASMIISLTLVPIYQYAVNKNKDGKKSSEREPGLIGNSLKRLSDFYADKVVASVLKRPFVVGIGGVVITTLLFGLAFLTPFEFFPAANKKEVVVNVTLPVENSLTETYDTLEKITKDINEVEGIEETSIFAGKGLPNLFNASMDNTGSNTGQIVARVDNETLTSSQFIDDMTEPLREAYPEAEIFLNTIVQGPPTGAPVTVDISGEDFTKLNEIKNELRKNIQEVDNGLVIDDVKEPVETITYELNREEMAKQGIDAKFISDQLRVVTDGVPLGSFQRGQDDMDLVLKLDEETHAEGINLEEINVPIQTGGPVPELAPLSDFVTEKNVEEYKTIPHKDGERTITLKAYPGESETFKEDVEGIVKDLQKKYENENYQLTTGGENDDQTQFFVEITLLFGVVMVLIYLTIALQFNSFLLPLLVLGTVYLAIAGAVTGLFVTQTPFSFMATMGIVSLAGIVVRNSVVLFEFIEQRRKAGMELVESIIEAGRSRIRPILLTAFTALVSLLPVAFSNDPLFKPLAISIVSGVLFSTILTLVIVPALYLLVAKLRKVK
ncbi:efflux RND transporter permease subunit [Bacillus sp. CGMCC 1.16541]|uniref:efflux RND transporter permease subunit n=1 Tax=Bacillus sp. CGMCC 1.16541 TaxID=2185143 RepID=UPI000D73F34B|nr:efflux RND transporter permease subunit [Bacillus sp. CGMCC 1.16541]